MIRFTQIHELKTDPQVFQAVWDHLKTFEIRNNDRGFQEGDVLHLKETQHSGEEMANGAPLIYTGREIKAEALYVLEGPVYGLHAGWCIISIYEKCRRIRCEDDEERARKTNAS